MGICDPIQNFQLRFSLLGNSSVYSMTLSVHIIQSRQPRWNFSAAVDRRWLVHSCVVIIYKRPTVAVYKQLQQIIAAREIRTYHQLDFSFLSVAQIR